MTELRAGVIGAGVFGGYHARKYASLAGVRLAAVFDHHIAHAMALAEPLGAAAFDKLDAFLEAVDVVTVATPADSHAALALKSLEAGKATYVEKPLATRLGDAQSLVSAAAEQGLVLACGHQERVVFAAMGLLDLPEPPLRLDAVRRGTPSDRNRDVSCVLDLMIHDLDLAASLARGPARVIEASGGFDAVSATVTFQNGLVAHFEASRVASARERVMRLEFASGAVEIDFLAPSFRNDTLLRLDSAFASTPQGRDPLGASVGGFLAAVRKEAPRPPVTGEEGVRALELALAIEAAAGVGAGRA